MDPRATRADAVLERLLLIVPLAARAGGASVSELAEQLGVPAARVLKDLREVEGRSYYLQAGMGDQIQLSLTRERIEVWTTGEFRRPVRLTPREAIGVELALRLLHRSAPEGDRGEIDALRSRVVEALRTPHDGAGANPSMALGVGEDPVDAVRSAVESALEGGHEVRLRYASPGRDPSGRRVAPLQLVHAEGQWYLLARDLDRGGYRAFRLDRILEVHASERPFPPLPGDGPAVEGFLRDGWVHDGGGQDRVVAIVEYSREIARWIRERRWDGMEEAPGGGVRVSHTVTDPEWLVRHVLGYGGEARLLEPDGLRNRIRDAALRMTDGP